MGSHRTVVWKTQIDQCYRHFTRGTSIPILDRHFLSAGQSNAGSRVMHFNAHLFASFVLFLADAGNLALCRLQ